MWKQKDQNEMTDYWPNTAITRIRSSTIYFNVVKNVVFMHEKIMFSNTVQIQPQRLQINTIFLLSNFRLLEQKVQQCEDLTFEVSADDFLHSNL